MQIAGLVARRIIVCRVTRGADAPDRARFGMIQLRLRLDVYLPAGVAPLAGLSQIVRREDPCWPISPRTSRARTTELI